MPFNFEELSPFYNPRTKVVGDYSSIDLQPDQYGSRLAARDQTFETFGQQNELNQALRLRALGLGGPSPAELEANRRSEQNQRQALALAASGTGPSAAGNTRAAIFQNSLGSIQLEPILQELRAREQTAAQQTYGSALQNLTAGAQQQQQIGQQDQLAQLISDTQLRTSENTRKEEAQKGKQSGFEKLSNIVGSVGPSLAGLF